MSVLNPIPFHLFSISPKLLDFASESLLIPGPEAESLNVSADVDATPGVPGLADFGGRSKMGGVGWRGDSFPISYIYREGGWGVLQ